MRTVLQNPSLQNQFDQDGVITVKLLSSGQMDALRSLVQRLKDDQKKQMANVDSDYELSFFNSNAAYRKMVFNEIWQFFKGRVNEVLDDYVPLIINIFDKVPGTGEVPVHQNWTFVDEAKYTSVSVWIPLVDVSRKNGTLEVVKGSHRILTPFRGPSIPWVFNDLFDQLREKYLEPLTFSAGTAGVIDDSIIHWSSENHSANVRTAIQLIMIPREATPIHYYRNPEEPNKLEVFEVDSDFFTTFNMFEKPVGVKSIGHVPFDYKNFSEEELIKQIATQNPEILEKV